MPIRNMGTLLENIVLVEAFRLLSHGNPGTTPVDFVNSFAMPPLSAWCIHGTDYGFSAAQLNTLQAGPPALPVTSFQGMMWSCLQQPPVQPGTQGPNGAILCGMLAHHLGCPIRMWLNDIPNGHYGNALPGLAAINTILQQVLGLPTTPQNAVVTCDQGWPDSLTQPAHNNLTGTIAAWSNNAHARLGFLDPMRYRINNAQGGETDSASHQRWLALLTNGFARTVISTQFTGHRYWKALRPEIQRMHCDGLQQGYFHSLIASHSHYHVVCNIKHPDGDKATHVLAVQLKGAVQLAWNSWYAAIGRGRHKLVLVVI